MNGLFNPTKVPVKVSKLNPVSKGTMTSLIGCSETVDFLIRESRISLSFTVNDPCYASSRLPHVHLLLFALRLQAKLCSVMVQWFREWISLQEHNITYAHSWEMCSHDHWKNVSKFLKTTQWFFTTYFEIPSLIFRCDLKSLFGLWYP